MRLLYTPSVNYIHKVLVFAHEAKLMDRLELVRTVPFDPAYEYRQHNPLAKVPTLLLDDGEAIYGGPVICEYFDWLGPGPKLYPPAEPERFTVLTGVTLAEGIFESAVALSLETRYPPEQHRPRDIDRFWDKIVRGMDRLERDAASYGALRADQVFAAGAISFVQMIVPNLAKKIASLDADWNWRDGRPALSAWYDRIVQRPSFAAKITIP